MKAPAQCPLCDGTDLELWWSDPKRRLLRCRACDGRFLWPRPESSALAAVYSDAYFREHYLAHAELRLAYFRNRLRELERLTPHRRVIDLGCGPGFFLRAAIEAGWEAAGMDVSPVAVRHARAAGVHAVQAELADYTPPFEPGVVTMWDVIAHVPDPRAFATRAAALLPPGGLLVMKFPHRHRSLYQSARFLSRVMPTAGLLALTAQPYHFSPASAQHLLQTGGCRQVALEEVDEVELPTASTDSLRLRTAKVATSIMVRAGMYQSLMVCGERRDTAAS